MEEVDHDAHVKRGFRRADVGDVGPPLLVARRGGKIPVQVIAHVHRALNGCLLARAETLGRSPESWLAMQDMHDLAVARSQIDLAGIEPLTFDEAAH